MRRRLLPQSRRHRVPARGAVKPHRAFDPRTVGRLETEAWVAYYRHEWLVFLRAAVRLTRHAFGLPWHETLYGSWLVLRANQQWAAVPDNDPAGARRSMERFYRLVANRHHEPIDPAVAAGLEVEWWRAHRSHQRAGGSEADLVGALADLYAYVYRVPADTVRLAAEQRALAMRSSDQWVADGCDRGSPLIGQIAAALVRSYAALLAAVHRQD
jgi:hypothetical protein